MHIKSSGKSQWGKVTFHVTFLAIFSKIQGFFVLFPPNYSNLVSDDWSDYTMSVDTSLYLITMVISWGCLLPWQLRFMEKIAQIQ